ncbi:uncharacterized protein LY89DRAFT_363751 [Mollisia scopiformis]|uniref:Xylanolytic transcriptional activator regulatory domain-containing protein n=1 Tax=Mollisia scopiformis TaxID=149040 RepID=A0A132B4K4_MOLSC|nr:uncharacterized protein LY89DRAFT_363751 [Mollisia scopiformis]KUJ07338.1 hypothetical protein LY89DRAFT_363751 [Mollisia scopiformis]
MADVEFSERYHLVVKHHGAELLFLHDRLQDQPWLHLRLPTDDQTPQSLIVITGILCLSDLIRGIDEGYFDCLRHELHDYEQYHAPPSLQIIQGNLMLGLCQMCKAQFKQSHLRIARATNLARVLNLDNPESMDNTIDPMEARLTFFTCVILERMVTAISAPPMVVLDRIQVPWPCSRENIRRGTDTEKPDPLLRIYIKALEWFSLLMQHKSSAHDHLRKECDSKFTEPELAACKEGRTNPDLARRISVVLHFCLFQRRREEKRITEFLEELEAYSDTDLSRILEAPFFAWCVKEMMVVAQEFKHDLSNACPKLESRVVPMMDRLHIIRSHRAYPDGLVRIKSESGLVMEGISKSRTLAWYGMIFGYAWQVIAVGLAVAVAVAVAFCCCCTMRLFALPPFSS